MLSDLRTTLRSLAGAPGFALLVILTLALGLGAGTAVFSVANAVLLRPLPFAGVDRVVVLGEASRSSDARLVAPVTFDDWRTRQRPFAEIAAFRYWETVNLEDTTGDPEAITLTTGTENLFRALGIAPRIGRTYREEQRAAGGSEAVISHELWTRRYHGDPGVLGRVVRIRGAAATIVGVMPPMPAAVAAGWGDVWTCLYRYDIAQQRATGYRARYLTVVGRLSPGVSVAQARTEMDSLQRQLWTEPTSVADGFDVRLEPLADVLLGETRLPLLVVAGGVAVLLIVACANVTTLMLVRTASRRRETALRLALGAHPSRVVRLLVLEGVVLALTGGTLGLAIAWAGLQATAGIGASIPRLSDAALTPDVVAFALGLSMITALACSVAPLAELRRANLSGVLSESGRSGTASPRAQRLRRTLVGLQVAMACLLLVVGSLLLRSFANVLRVDPGFDAAHAVSLDLYLPSSRYPDEAAYTRFYRELTRRLEEIPGAERAGALLYFPYKPKLWTAAVEIEGRPVPEGQEPIVFFNQIAGAYFDAMGIPLLSGRLPTEREIWEAGAPRVAVVNRTLARQLFGDADPLGRRIRDGRTAPWSEIVGVVGDVRQQRLDRVPAPEYFATFQTMPMPFQTVVVRGRGSEMTPAAVRDAVRGLDPGVATANLMPLSAWVRAHTRERQFALWVLASFALLALALGSIGVYGAVSHTVGQQRREMGIRLALGETPRGLRTLVLGDGLRVVAAGAVAGLATAAGTAPFLSRMLFDVSAFDPLVYAGVPLLLALVAMLACWRPAHRAAHTDVAVVLRND